MPTKIIWPTFYSIRPDASKVTLSLGLPFAAAASKTTCILRQTSSVAIFISFEGGLAKVSLRVARIKISCLAYSLCPAVRCQAKNSSNSQEVLGTSST